MLLKTERLTIRPIRADDWRGIQEIWKDFACSPFARYDMPHDTADEAVRSRIARWSGFGGSTEHMFFAICLPEGLIGYIAFNQRPSGHEVGYCFHSAFHGRGYAKESFLALLAFLKSLGMKHIFARTALANDPSVALLKSLGFHQTGTEQVSFYRDADGNDIVFEGGIFERMAD